MARQISSIYGHGPTPDPTGEIAERRRKEARAKLWQEMGQAILDPDEIEDEWAAQVVRNEANRLYGKRGASTGSAEDEPWTSRPPRPARARKL